MVFGWGKKKKVEYEEPAEPVNSSPQNIQLDEIPKILNDIVILRKGTLAVSYTHLRAHETGA